MAKKIIIKQVSKINNKWVVPIVAFLAALGIGGLFLAGGFQGGMLLKLIPAIGHTIVGWAIIISTILAAVLKLVK